MHMFKLMGKKITQFSAKNAYTDFNVYCRELAPGTVSLTGDRAQGEDSKQCAYSNCPDVLYLQ